MGCLQVIGSVTDGRIVLAGLIDFIYMPCFSLYFAYRSKQFPTADSWWLTWLKLVVEMVETGFRVNLLLRESKKKCKQWANPLFCSFNTASTFSLPLKLTAD